ncbi:MAG: hypothetical protein WBG40_17955, partial [Candidatus Sulfotelmatobacter sp.]
MTLFDDTTTHHSDSAVATETEPMATETTSTEQSLTDQSVTQQDQAPVATAASTSASTDEASHPTPAADDKHAGEDFASALENFTTETEEAVGEDRVIKGTVLKLTATHV